MAPKLYDVVYRGKILPGFDFESVKSKVMELFSLSDEKAAKILKSSRVVLKKGADEAGAKKLGTALKRAGLDVALSISKEAPTAPASAPAPPTAEETKMETQQPAQEAPLDDSPADEGMAADQTALQTDAEISRLPFEFKGKGGEYFKIWLVNIILSIVTLGIYSAWAKVRRKQYFYGSTTIQGSSFEYLASPLKILKGRLIVAGFFILYSVLSSFVPIIAGIMSLAFILILPWLIVRSLTFNARNSAFRNIRFGFKGSTMDAAKVFIMWPLLIPFTLGFIFPYVYFRQKKFVVENTLYGTTPFVFTATTREYYRIYFSAIIPVVIGIALMVGAGFLFPPIAVLVILVLYLYMMAFFAVKTINLLFNTTSLAHHRFEAGLKITEYLILIVTNSLGVALTLGIFYPWAKVRTNRYKLEHMALIAEGDLEGFIAGEEQQVSALGEEVGDFFDMDFGI